MEKISSEIWNLLETSLPSGENLSAKPAAPDKSMRIFYAIDSEQQRHILIQLEESDMSYSDHQSRGIQVTTRELNVPGQEPSGYIDLLCLDPSGYAGFDIIGNEITANLLKGTQAPAEIVHQVLARWRRFWGQIPQDLLSRNEVIGLIAEIRYLSERLIPETGAAESLNRWRGPFGSRHDFEWSGCSVEVKATTSSRGRIFHINGIDQLDPPENGKLFFFGVRLREEGGAETTLPGAVQTCLDLLSSDGDLIEKFEDILVRAGYSPLHREEYEKMRFRIIDEFLFEVTEDFPRIGISSFSEGIPGGVERIEYEINLNNY